MYPVLLALGSNLADRAGNLQRALAGLQPTVRIEAVSRIYETAPMYCTDQPSFLNMALKGETALTAPALLGFLKGLEKILGRCPSARFGPRLIDIDILFHDDTILDEPELQLPHPRMAERAFVLRPLADLAPDLRHPLLGQTVAELLAALPDDEGIRLWPIAAAIPPPGGP